MKPPEKVPPVVELKGTRLPYRLLDMKVPPEVVYLWGELPPGPYVAIVGTRQPSDEGAAAAFELACSLAQSGVTVISGGAHGVDAAAHRGALAGGGPTLVIAPTWYETHFPRDNGELFAEILRRGGGYLTPATREKKPLQSAFFRRNEAMAALANALVIGESRYRSGARNAAKHARNLDRRLFALPSKFGLSTSQGPCQEIIEGGAEPLWSAEGVLRALLQQGSFDNPRWWDYLERTRLASVKEPSRRSRRRGGGPQVPAQPSRRDPERAVQLGKEAQQILQMIQEGSGAVDEICDKSGLSPAVVQYQILLLTLEGLLSEDESRTFALPPGVNDGL